MNQINTPTAQQLHLTTQVAAYALLHKHHDFGWWVLNDNYQQLGNFELLEIVTDAKATTVVQAIAAAQAVATALNVD
jgi:hypothetical protein